MRFRSITLWAALLAALPLAAGDAAVVRRIFVTRHGQPDLKRERPKYNSGDHLLSPLGLKQAAALGKYLKKQNFQGRIYASPYLRTVETAVVIGRELGLPDVLVDKVPIDGLCGKTDEENLGFTYAELDRYIREGVIDDPEKKALIDRKHKANLFKLQFMPCFKPDL